jgi:NitT/TauT family transport system substrate-binding protein
MICGTIGAPAPAGSGGGTPAVEVRRSYQRERAMQIYRILAAAGLLLAASPLPASAEDSLRLAVGQRGNWDTSVAELGQRSGIFRKRDLTLDILYTQGGGETQQAVIAGSADVGVAAGVMGVFSAYAKGAPVRILGAEATGGADLFWYVRAGSPIASLRDTAGRSIAYSTTGSSTHGIVMAFMRQYGLQARPIATGGPAATLTQVMSGQIDVGWSAPPFGLDQIDQKQIRIIASGSDADAFRGQTVRLLITNLSALRTRRDVLDRFMAGYRDTIEWMYAGDAPLKIHADWLGITIDKARRTRDDFFPKAALDPDRVVGLDVIVKDAVALKYTQSILGDAQLTELIHIPPRR